MSHCDTEPMHDEDLQDDAIPHVSYRAISKGAVLAMILAMLSLPALIFPTLLLLPLLGLASGVLAIRNIRRYREELSGRVVAILGVVSCAALLLGGIARHSYVYATEVPEGYLRISFSQLQPDKRHPELLVSADARELDGRLIFVKGYIHPGVSALGEIHQFVLVPDMKTCCFGGQPKMSDMIEVTLTSEQGVRYTQLKRKITGVFRVNDSLRQVSGGLTGGLYSLKGEARR